MSLEAGAGARVQEARGIGALEGWVDRLLSPLHRAAAGVSLTRADALAMAALWAVAAVWVWYGAGFFTSEAWAARRSLDLYFDADLPRTLEHLTRRLQNFTGHHRSHPIFALLLYPPTSAVTELVGDRFLAVRVVITGLVPLAAPLLHLLARGCGCPASVSALAALSGLCTAAFTHWAPVPETFSFSLVTIAAPFALLAASPTQRAVPWVLTTAFSAAITVTNGAAAGLSVFARHPLRRSLLIGTLGIVLVILLRVVQAQFFPKTGLLFGIEEIGNRLRFLAVSHPEIERAIQRGHVVPFSDFGWRLEDRLAGLLLFAGVAPEPNLRPAPGRTPPDIGFVVSYEEAPLSALGLVGGIAAGAWVALLLLGLWGALRSPRRDVAAATLGFLLFHLALHMVFGELVFLFVLHSLPSYAALVAFALAGPQRSLALPLALLLLATAAPTNALRFTHAATLANGLLHGTLGPVRS